MNLGLVFTKSFASFGASGIWARIPIAQIPLLLTAHEYFIRQKAKMVDRILQWDHESYKSKYNSLYPIDQSNLIYKDRRIESFEKSEVQLPQQIFELKKSGFVLDQAAKLSIAEKWRLLIIDRLAQIEEIEKRSIEYKGGRTMLAEKKACISPH